MDRQKFLLTETPYAGGAPDFSAPKQLNLFERKKERLDSLELQREIRASELEDLQAPYSKKQAIHNALLSFQLTPQRHNASRHLRKAGVAESAQVSLARDWLKVSRDIKISFMRKALEVNRSFE